MEKTAIISALVAAGYSADYINSYCAHCLPSLETADSYLAAVAQSITDTASTPDSHADSYAAATKNPRIHAKNNHPTYKIIKKYPRTIQIQRVQLADGCNIYDTVQPDGAPSLAVVLDTPAEDPCQRGRLYTGSRAPAPAPIITIDYGVPVPSTRPLDGCIPFASVHRTAGSASGRLPRKITAQMDVHIIAWTAAQDSARVAVLPCIHTKTDTTPIYFKRTNAKKRVLWERPIAYAEYGQNIDFAPLPKERGEKIETQDTTPAAPAPTYKASYAAQHTIMGNVQTPLLDIAGAVACNAVKYRYQDSGLPRFLSLQWDNSRDFARNNAGKNIQTLADDYTAAAAALAAAEDIAKRDAKILGLKNHVKSQYISENTAAEKTALQRVKNAIVAAEKLDNTTISDFADIKSAAYIAGYNLLSQYFRWYAKKNGVSFETVDCEECINSMLAYNAAEKDALNAAKKARDDAKDAAKKAGYKRLVDFAPYQAAKQLYDKYNNRNLIAVMARAARAYIGGQDHDGKSIAADIDAAARRAKDVTSAENAALYKAVDDAAEYDAYYTAIRADLLSIVQDDRARVALAAYIDGYTMQAIAARLAAVYPTEKWYTMRVSRLIATARADIANADGYKDNIQCTAYLDAIAARVK